MSPSNNVQFITLSNTVEHINAIHALLIDCAQSGDLSYRDRPYIQSTILDGKHIAAVISDENEVGSQKIIGIVWLTAVGNWQEMHGGVLGEYRKANIATQLIKRMKIEPGNYFAVSDPRLAQGMNRYTPTKIVTLDELKTIDQELFLFCEQKLAKKRKSLGKESVISIDQVR